MSATTATLLALVLQAQGELRSAPASRFEGALPSVVVGTEAPAFARVVRGTAQAELVVQGLGAIAEPRTQAAGPGWFLNWADIPAVARLADGTTLAVWLETTEGHAHSYGTRFQLLDPAGDPQAEPRRLEEHTGPGEHGFVSLVPLDAERFLALWLDGRTMDAHGGGHMQVLARTVARDGTLGPEKVVDPSACSCCPTSLVRLADGTVLAAWRDRSAAEVRDIALARFDGTRWSAPVPLHADGWEIHGCPVNGPRLAASAVHVAAAWYTGVDGSVRVAFGKSDGSAFALPVRVDEGGGEGRGDAVFLADGALLVGWLEHDEGRVAWKLRRVWPDGRLGAVHELAPISGERSAGFLRLAPGDGGAWALWTEPGKTPHVLAARVTGP